MRSAESSTALPFKGARNFVERLEQLARERPDDTALIVVQAVAGVDQERRFSYQVLAQRVRALAAVLQARLGRGERALILLDNDEYYAISMFACFYAGVIAVPVFPPESASAAHTGRLAGIAADAGARGLLILDANRALVAACEGLQQAEMIAVDQIGAGDRGPWQAAAPDPQEIAFLQYTSGSTSAPKGVMVTHAALMANEAAIREGLSIGEGDSFCVWSPLFHDMGLIGGLLQPFYSGIVCVLCSPRYFLERPVRWLQMIARHRVSISGGPDFAYRLCLDRIKDRQLEGLDLSCWRVAYTGAEPVRHQTMEAFVQRFASVGLDPAAVYPCYGLAEATLFVTGGRRGAGLRVQRYLPHALRSRLALPADAEEPAVALVACGRAPSQHQVRIAADASGAPAAPGAIGEIWVTGPSIARGYWKQALQSAQTFVELENQTWLRTGDLGFWADGELFVAGRLKDMIIVRGHNIYPQDLEQALEAEVEALRKGRIAVFAVSLDTEEGVGVAVEVSRGMQKLVAPQALCEAVATVVQRQCGEAPQVLVLLNPGGLPKTSSGKLQRGACRTGWHQGSLDAYAVFEQGRMVQGSQSTTMATVPPVAAQRAGEPEVRAALALLWQEVLMPGVAGEPSADAHFLACGGNSLAAVQLAARISQHWQIAFAASQVFEYPRLQQQAALILDALEDGKGGTATGIARLSEAQRRTPQPLSSAQQRQWFLWQLAPQSTAYHVQGALRLGGPLDVFALQRAFNALMRRHEALQTVFRSTDQGQLEQVVGTQPVAELELVEADTGPNGALSLPAALDLLQQRHGQPFDLTHGPLVRACLLALDDGSHVLGMVMHHIISDGASMHLLIEELAQLYAELHAGRQSGLAPAILHYVDYIAWQQARADDPEHRVALDYWARELAVPAGQAQPVLALPVDRARPVLARYHASHHHFALPDDLLAGLRGQARQAGVTLFALLLSGLQALLHRYTGQQDIRVGVPVANRSHPDLLGVVGFFVNTLVLRASFDEDITLAQLLAQTAQRTLLAQRHQGLSFEQLVEVLQPERSLTHSALFQVMFNHLPQHYAASAQGLGDVVEELFLPDREAQFELTLDTREHPDGRVSAVLTYAKELFDPQRIAQLAQSYLAILRALVDEPQQLVAEVALLSPAQQAQLQQWGCNPQRYPLDPPIHVRIAQQARRTPEAIALVLDRQQLSYAQLEARANQMARQLLAMGVQPEQRIGLALERSLDMVPALLAILKAGACFVPLDPQYPRARLTAMIEDSRIRLALTQSHMREHLPGQAGVRWLELDRLPAPAATSDFMEAPDVITHPAQLAYVIYTSGSTGRPKGVAVSHGALVEHTQLSAEFSRLRNDDRMLQFATLNFDGFIEQLFPPLLVGASVVLRGPQLWSPEEFQQRLREHEISIADLPTAYWHALIQSFARQGQSDYGRLREIHIGGEAMPAESIATWRQAGLSAVRLLNTYGPTEAVVVASLLDCDPFVQGQREVPTQMPIGQPLAGRSLHVLDERLQALPAGVPGELYIGGDLLARGYLERPGLTAERFVADPGSEAGGRLYRTGDLVCWNAQGELHYLGRSDLQVKLRGFRVELGEIEAQLLAQPEVRQAIVVAHQARLVGYASLYPGQELSTAQLRERLRASLPDYMVPATVIVLEQLPTNPNGKIDRHALPAPADVIAVGGLAPVGQLEEQLAGIWRELLRLEQVGRDDNFFELGGHSLLLLVAHERIKALSLACVPSVVDLFRYPTIATLAAFLDGAAPTRNDAGPALEERAARQRGGFLSRRRQPSGAEQ
ncbi:UNVERIFIED_ORG: amino acid adenylation domain-containing protein [Herbaspirillum seropedicae]